MCPEVSNRISGTRLVNLPNVLLAVIGVFTLTTSGTVMPIDTIKSPEDIENCLSKFVSEEEKLVLLLDYDGTLSELAPTPEDAITVLRSEEALNYLSKLDNVYLAIISGREISSAAAKVNLQNTTYAGNHGLEIKFAKGDSFTYPLPDETKNTFNKLIEELRTQFSNDEGVFVEDKTFSLTVHYRNVEDPNEKPRIHNLALETIKACGFKANGGKEAVEGKPPVDWNKGKAAKYILKREFGDDWRQNVKVIFMGDDTTDEDAMKELKGSGVISFRVSKTNVDTNADYIIPSTETVSDILQWLYNQMSLEHSADEITPDGTITSEEISPDEVSVDDMSSETKCNHSNSSDIL